MSRGVAAAFLLSLVLVSALLPQAAYGAAPKNKRQQARAALRGSLKNVSRKMNSVRAQLKQAKRGEADIAQDLITIRARLQATRGRLSESKARLAAARREQAKVAKH